MDRASNSSSIICYEFLPDPFPTRSQSGFSETYTWLHPLPITPFHWLPITLRLKLKRLIVDNAAPAWSDFYLLLQQSLIFSIPFSFSYSPCTLLFHRTFSLCPYAKVFFPLLFSLIHSYSSLAFIFAFTTMGKTCLHPPTTSYSLSCILHFQIFDLTTLINFCHSTRLLAKEGWDCICFCFSTIPVPNECLTHWGSNIC